MPGRGIDREQGGIGTTRDRIGQHRAGIRIDRPNHCHCRLIFRNTNRCRCPTAVRADHRCFVDILHRDGDRLLVRETAIVDSADDDIIDIVLALIGRVFEIGSRLEGKHAGGRVDGEEIRIRAAGDRIDDRFTRIGIRCRDGRDGRLVFRDGNR